MPANTLLFTLKDEFAQAARKGDFSAPALSHLDTLVKWHGLNIDPLYIEGSMAVQEAGAFFVSGTAAHETDFIAALKANPAVQDVEKPAPRKLI